MWQTFELIPWILAQCGDVGEARALLEHINIWDENFSAGLPAATLHWMISDREQSIVVEAVSDGIKIYDDPVGVLTNNPPFDFQMLYLDNFMNITAEQAVNRFSEKLDLKPYSLGMGGLGASGGFILFFQICESRIYKNEFGFRRFGDGECQPVFSYSGRCGAAAGLREG